MPESLRLYLHTYSLRFHLAYKKGFDVFAFIKRAAEESFAGVCISANDSNYRHLGGTEDWRLEPIAAALKQHALHCDIDTSSTEPKHLTKMLKVAQALGAQHLRTYTRYEGNSAELLDQTVQDLKAVAPIAQELGIYVLLENHETFTGQDIKHILEAVNQPFIAALYDYGNSQMVLEDPVDCLKEMAAFARSAHLKDHVLIKAKDSPDKKLSVLGVPIGEGNLPILETTRVLLKAGCSNIVFENSYGYRALIKEAYMTERNKALLGQGSFAFAENPRLNPKQYLLEPDVFSHEQLIVLEDAMHKRSLKWLREALML